LIGAGDIKVMRDLAATGYTVGVTIEDPSAPPKLISESNSHVLAYDLECEYLGPQTFNLQSPILCACLKCSCGYEAIVSRTPLIQRERKYVLVPSNQLISEAVIRLIISHAPTFTIGLNMYEFDNVRLGCSLPKESPFRKYFVPTSNMLGKSVASAGFILCLPGINNVETLRYVRKAMPERFQSFTLGSLAKDLELANKKLDTSNIGFNLEWYSRSVTNSLSMVRYNMMDCQVNLDVCFKLDLMNKMVAICNATRSYIIDVILYSTGATAASALCSYALRCGKEYVWTRCDYHPVEFLGGHDDPWVNLMVRRSLRIWICNQSLDFFLGQTVDACDLPVAQLV
jgi:DNA polymerase elongation subunit (family B)